MREISCHRQVPREDLIRGKRDLRDHVEKEVRRELMRKLGDVAFGTPVVLSIHYMWGFPAGDVWPSGYIEIYQGVATWEPLSEYNERRDRRS